VAVGAACLYAATRQRALQLIADAEASGRKLTGAQLGRAIGRSDHCGRLLLREFRTTTSAAATASRPHDRPGAPAAALAYAARGFRVLPLRHPLQTSNRRQPGGSAAPAATLAAAQSASTPHAELEF
jgi:hypothetical protein